MLNLMESGQMNVFCIHSVYVKQICKDIIGICNKQRFYTSAAFNTKLLLRVY